MRMSGLKLCLLSASITLAFPCFAAGNITNAASDEPAQEVVQGQEAGQKGSPVTLNVITVNADRSKGYKTKYVQVGAFRDQTALDTPSTVNVFTRELMEAQNVTGVFDVLKNSAGVTRSQTNGMFADNLTIRGLEVQNRSNYRLNGALPVNNLVSMPMENKERVEVLKGSSALYYGFTSPGGVINMVTKRAESTPNLSLQTAWNEYGQIIGSVDAGMRFGDNNQFGIRVNAAGGQLGNYGIDHVKGSRALFSIAADWKVNDRLDLYFDYEKASRSINEQAIIAVPGAVSGVITLPARPKYSNLLSPGRWAVTKGDVENILGKAVFGISDNWFGSVEMGRAVTNRTDRGLGIFRLTNLATGAGTLSMTMNEGERYVNDNVRAEITGLIPMGGLISNEIAIGVMQNKRFQNSARGDARNVYAQNLYNPTSFDRRYPFVRPAEGFRPQNARDNGIYLFDRVRIGEQLQVVLGARRADYKNVSVTSPTTTTTYKAKKTSPSASVVYQFRHDTSIYASYIEGLEEGETAPTIGVINPGEVFGPKVSKQKELGIKTEALKGVTATLALFDMNVPTPGFQVPTSTPPLNRYVQEGMSRYRGVEFTVTGAITPELSISAGGMLMDASQDKAVNPLQVGKVPDSTVEHTFNAYLDYQPSWAPGFGFSAGSFYIGQRPLGPLEQVFLAGYTTHSIGARYATTLGGGRKLSFQLNVDNVTNKDYWAGGNNYVAVGAPRTISLVTKLDLF